MMDDRIVLSLLVDNTAGVLARVAGAGATTLRA